MRFGVQGSSLGLAQVLNRAAEIGGFDQRVLIAMASMTEYLTDAFWPTSEVAPNRVLGIPIADPVRISSSAATLGGLAIVGVMAVRAGPLRRTAALLLATFAAALVPVCNILPAPTYAGELQIATRYLTFPLAFAALALAVCCAGALRLVQARKFLPPAIAGGLLAVWFGAAAYIINDNIPRWADRETFYRFAISQMPPSSWPYLYANLGGHYLENEKHAEARDTFAFAIATRPKSAALAGVLWYNLGTAEAGLGNQERAISAFRIAVETDPSNLMARAGIAEIERRRGNHDAAIALLDGVLQARGGPLPREPAGWLHYQLGLTYLQAGRADRARSEFDAARALLRDARSLARVEQSMAELNKTAK
jgi:tetratricopeptide (TPR) repeat protein